MSTRCLIARLGDERLAVPIATVSSVLDAPAVVPAPLAPAALAGHLEHEGQRLPVLDAGELFGVRRHAGPGVAVVLREPAVALWMDDADDVWEVAAEDLQPAPALRDLPPVLGGLLQRGSTVVGVVDATALSAAIAASLQESR